MNCPGKGITSKEAVLQLRQTLKELAARACLLNSVIYSFLDKDLSGVPLGLPYSEEKLNVSQ